MTRRVRLQQRHGLPLLPGEQGALPQVVGVLGDDARALRLVRVEPRLRRRGSEVLRLCPAEWHSTTEGARCAAYWNKQRDPSWQREQA